MNLIGKIFIVLIFVLALSFMILAVLVYATHRNYREEIMKEPSGLRFQLKNLREENKTLSDSLDKTKKELETERTDKINALAKLETEVVQSQQDLSQLQKEKATLTDDLRRDVAAMKAAQDESNKFGEEAKVLRGDIEKAQMDRRMHEKEVGRLTDESHQLRNDVKLLKERNTTLTADLTKAKLVLRHFGMSPDTNIAGTAPQVDGIVEAVPGEGLVEINLGSDDGLMQGHKLDVVRVGSAGSKPKYVGRIEVVHLTADRAVCRIDPKYQKSDVQVDDRVYSKLQ
jgi:hypothetical protein